MTTTSGSVGVLPDALIVGVQRAGTTSTYRYLTQHPQLVTPVRKEVHYFDLEPHFARGERWYRSHFPTVEDIARLELEDGRPRSAIEATPAYMFRAHVPARMKALLPAARLIVVLRDPVTRALSHWKLAGKMNAQYGTFEIEVDHELAAADGRAGPLGEQVPRGLLARGHYADQIERLWQHYPRAQVLVVESAQLFADPTAFCAPIFDFLGLEPITIDAHRRHNASVDPTVVSSRTRSALEQYFGPHNARLAGLLGRAPMWGYLTPGLGCCRVRLYRERHQLLRSVSTMARKTVHDLVAEARAQIEELTVADLQAELAAGQCTVIDIRDIRERVQLGVIPGAISAPRGMLEFWFDPESPYHQDRYQFDNRYVFHCAAGWRSALAAKVIGELGYTNVAHLEPGFKGWVDEGGEVEDISETSKWVKHA